MDDEHKTIEGTSRRNDEVPENHPLAELVGNTVERVGMIIVSIIAIFVATKYGPALGDILFPFISDKPLFFDY